MSSAEPPRNPDRRSIALLGKNSALKTSIEDFILKRPRAVPRTFVDFTVQENKSFRIINAPDFFDETYLDQKIIDLIALSDPGPDLLVLALDSDDANQVETAEAQSINKLHQIFGETIRNRLVIIVKNSETVKHLRPRYSGQFNIQVLSENLPDQCMNLLPAQSFQFDSESYFWNAVKRRKGLWETSSYYSRHEGLPHHYEDRDLSLQSSPQRIPPESGLGIVHSGPGTDITIVLLGSTGTGKSASANTILAAGSSQLSGFSLSRKPPLDPSQRFESHPSSTPVTTKCEAKTAEMCGTRVTVVDTPNFFYEEEHVDRAQIDECKKHCQPWCVVLLVIQLGRFTDGEREILEKLEKHLGWKIREKTIVLFTHGEDFNGSLEAFIGERSHLKKMLEVCGGRHHVFKNTVRDSHQVFALFEIIFAPSPNSAVKPSPECSLL